LGGLGNTTATDEDDDRANDDEGDANTLEVLVIALIGLDDELCTSAAEGVLTATDDDDDNAADDDVSEKSRDRIELLLTDRCGVEAETVVDTASELFTVDTAPGRDVVDDKADAACGEDEEEEKSRNAIGLLFAVLCGKSDDEALTL